MKISAQDWQQAFKLLDTALEIPEPARELWLKNLSPENAHLQPALSELLEQHAALQTEAFLQSLPEFTSVDAESDAAGSVTSGGLSANVSIGPYRLIRELGLGGMGAVWLAERSDGTLKRMVALKLPHAGPFQRQFAERFERERDILAALTHPNIARLYDAGATAAGQPYQPYLALEYVEGVPLTEYCASKNLGIRERLELFRQVLSAVQYAHNNLVLHRDLKPSNILVTSAGVVSLLDFGIAKFMTGNETRESALTELTGRAMTPDYASPEQIIGAPISTASDVYSLGVVLYELLSGSRPYKLKRGTRGELEDAILAVDAIRPSQMMRHRTGVQDALTLKTAKQLEGDLDIVCLKALKKKPEERYATVAAFASDITRWLQGYPIETRSDGSWYVVRKYVARHRSVVALSAITILAMVAGTIVSVIQAQRASAEAEIARQQSARARAVEQFLSGLFTANSVDQPDPEASRRLTAPQLLDQGAARIENSLTDFPDAKADVLATLSTMYVHVGDAKKAADLTVARLPLIEKSFGKNSIEYAQALVDVADKIKSLPNADEPVLRFTTDAKKILTELKQEKSLLFGELLRMESIVWRRRDLDMAVDSGASAVAIIRPFMRTKESAKLEAVAPALSPDPATDNARNTAKRLGTALGDLGRTYSARGNLIEANEALSEATKVLSETRGADNFDAAWVLMLKGSIDVLRGNFVDAEPALREGTRNVRRSGGLQQPASAFAESQLAWFLHMTGRREEATNMINEARARMAAKEGNLHSRTIDANVVYAGMLVTEGRFAEAIALLEPHADLNKPGMFPVHVVFGSALAQSSSGSSSSSVDNRQRDRASSYLNAAINVLEARKARNSQWWTEAMLARAEFAFARREYVAARADFNAVLAGISTNGYGPQYTARVHLGLARLDRMEGDMVAARAHLTSADALLRLPQVNGLLTTLAAAVRHESDAVKIASKK